MNVRRSYYWERFTDGKGSWRDERYRPSNTDLAALRRGIGRQAGTVPQLWHLYVTPVVDDSGSADSLRYRKIAAEHVALTTYGSHQQGRSQPMHRTGIGLGHAVTNLKLTKRFSDQALERRFAATATATSFSELTHHLRRLVALCRENQAVALDYTALVTDLAYWQSENVRPRIVRKWGLQYVWSRTDDEEPTETGE